MIDNTDGKGIETKRQKERGRERLRQMDKSGSREETVGVWWARARCSWKSVDKDEPSDQTRTVASSVKRGQKKGGGEELDCRMGREGGG